MKVTTGRETVEGMHWNRTKPVPVLVFSSPGLRDITPTELARSSSTVALDSKMPAALGWAVFLGLAGFAVWRSQRRQRTGSGYDAIDELREERERILQRVKARPVKRRRRAAA